MNPIPGLRMTAGSGRTALVLILILLAAGAGLRFYRLGAKALWLDEVFTIVRAENAGPGEIMERIKTNERHPPFFHLVSAPVLAISTSDAAVRIVPAVASILTLLLTGLLAWRMFGAAAGLAALGLSALSSFSVLEAQEGRPGALATLLLLLASYALFRLTGDARRPLQGRPRIAWLILYGVSVALSLFTYYYAVYIVLAQFVYLAAGGRRLRCRLPAAAAGAAGALFFVPWVVYAWSSLQRFSAMAAGDAPSNYSFRLAPDLARTLYATPMKFAAGWLNGLIAAAVLVQLAGAFYLLWQRRDGGERRPADDGSRQVGNGSASQGGEREHVGRDERPLDVQPRRNGLLLLAALLAVPLLAVYISPFKPPYFEPRHLAFVCPPVLILLGGMLASLRPRWAAALLGLLFLALNAGSLWFYYGERYQKSLVRQCAAAIAESARPGDALLFNPAFSVRSFERYEVEPVLPKVVVYPDRFDELAGRLSRYRRIWLVEYQSRTFGPLRSYSATAGRVRRFTGFRRQLPGIKETISVSLFGGGGPGGRRGRPSAETIE